MLLVMRLQLSGAEKRLAQCSPVVDPSAGNDGDAADAAARDKQIFAAVNDDLGMRRTVAGRLQLNFDLDDVHGVPNGLALLAETNSDQPAAAHHGQAID